MSSIDERVVQMRFDNAQFEKGVSQTIKTLSQLDKALDVKASAKSLASISTAASNINFDSATNSLTGFGGVAYSVFSDMIGGIDSVKDQIEALIGSLLSAAKTQTIIGGWTRASNLDQAKFQLRGLGVEFEKVNTSIQNAVMGTPFGMDAAASAAAQLVASGVQVGEEMDKALLGISGVAVMTNSSYEDISRIFTTIAGNGRIMTQQLNQIAGRGLNVAAALAEQLGLTEQEVRQLVHEGAIDFKTFSYAMDQAFGEHAKQANDTFSGAFANMKAALSRLGADFMVPIQEMLRRTSLGTRQVLENVITGMRSVREVIHPKNALGDTGAAGEWSIVRSFEENLGYIGDALDTFLTEFGHSGTIANLINAFVGPVDAIFHTIGWGAREIIENVFTRLSGLTFENLGHFMDAIAPKMYEFGDFLVKTIPLGFDTLGNVFQGLMNILRGIGSLLAPIGQAIWNLMGGSVDAVGQFLLDMGAKSVEVTGKFKEFTETLHLSDEAIAKVADFLAGVGKAIGSVVGAVGNVGGKALEAFFKLFEQAWPAISGVAEVLGSILGPALDVVGQAITVVADAIGNVISQIPEFLGQFIDFEAVGQTLHDIATTIGNAFQNVDLSGITKFVGDLVSGTADLEPVGNLIGTVASKFGELANAVTGNIPSRVDKISESFDRLKNSIGDFSISKLLGNSGKNSISGAFAGLLGDTDQTDQADKLTKSAEAARSFAHALSALGSVADTAKTSVKDFGANVLDFVQNISWDDILGGLSALVAGIVTGGVLKTLWDTSRVVIHLGEAFAKIIDIPAAISDLISGLSGLAESIGKAAKAEAYTDALLNIAKAVGILAASIFVISLIPADKLGQSVGVIAGMLVGIAAVGAGLIYLMDRMTKDMDVKKMLAWSSGMASISAVFTSMAAAIAVLALSAALLSNIPFDRLLPAVGAIVVLILTLGASVKLMKGAEKDLAAVGIGLLAMSLGMIALAAATAMFSAIPIPQLILGLSIVVGLILGISAMLGSDYMSKATGKLVGVGVAMALMSASMIALAAAVAAFGILPLDVLVKGLASVVVIMLALTALAKYAQGSALAIAAAGVAFALMSTFFLSLAASLAILSAIPDIGPGLVATLAVIIAAVASLYVLSGNAAGALGGAAAMAIFAGSVLLIAGALMAMSLVPTDKLLGAVVAIGALLVVFAIVASVATPVIGALKGLSIAFAIFGVAIMSIGVGLMLFATGLTLLAAISIAAFDQIGRGLEVLSEHLANVGVILAIGLGEAIVALNTTLAAKSGELSAAAGSLVIAFAGGLSIGQPALVNSGIQLFMGFLDGIMQNVEQIYLAAARIIIGLADGLRNYRAILLESVNSLVLSIGAALLSGLADVVQNIPGVGQAWADGLRGTADDMNAAAEELSQGVHSVIDEEMAKITPTAKNAMGDTASAISGSEGEMSGAADNAFGGLLDSVGVKLDGLPGMAEGKMDELMSTLEGSAGPAEEAGQGAGEGYYNGFENPMNQLPDMAQGKTQEAVDAAGSVPSWGSGYGVGSNFGEGMVNGVGAWAGSLAEKAASMVRDAVAKAKEAQKSASPSKVMYQVGSWFGEGYVLGIASMIATVGDTARNMAQVGVNEASGLLVTMSDLMSGVDWDAEPVITPVLDTTALEDGMNRVNGLLPQSTIGTEFMSNYAGLIPAIGGNGKTFIGDIYVTLDYKAGSDAMEMVDGIVSGLEDRLNLEA